MMENMPSRQHHCTHLQCDVSHHDYCAAILCRNNLAEPARQNRRSCRSIEVCPYHSIGLVYRASLTVQHRSGHNHPAPVHIDSSYFFCCLYFPSMCSPWAPSTADLLGGV